MKPYAAARIPQEDQELLRQVRLVFDALPEIDFGEKGNGKKILVSCHTICRALKPLFPSLKYVYGRYAALYEHSWLETENGSVIDVYPVGSVGGPILVAVEVYELTQLYLPQQLPLDRRFSHESRELIKQVRTIRSAAREVMRGLAVGSGKRE
jgi:hypothetical protein